MVADLCSNVLGWRSKLLNTIIFWGLSFELFVRFVCVCVWFVFSNFFGFCQRCSPPRAAPGVALPGVFRGGLEMP